MAIHPRNARLKELLLAAPYAICIERARYYTQSFRETEGQHPALRAAQAFAHTCRNVSIRILDDECIAGWRTSKPLGIAIPIERGDINTVLDVELDYLTRRERQPFHIEPEERRELEQELLPYWRGRTLRDRKKALWKANGLVFRPALGPISLYRRRRSLDLGRLREATAGPRLTLRYLWRGINELVYNNPGLVMNVFDVQGHLILGHRNILREGFAGIEARAAASLETARAEDDEEGSAFLEAVILCCQAIRDLASRYAEEAERLAEQATDPERRSELLAMAARCRHVPYEPPRDFAEAVQALWLTQVGGILAYGTPSIFAIGRLDQYLCPFYERDLSEGRTSQEAATALLEELLIKLSCGLLLLPAVGKRTGSEFGADSAAPTVGGVDADGNDATNPLSLLILDAFENVKAMGNSFTIRLSQKNPDAWWNRALATYRQTSGAALFCDEYHHRRARAHRRAAVRRARVWRDRLRRAYRRRRYLRLHVGQRSFAGGRARNDALQRAPAHDGTARRPAYRRPAALRRLRRSHGGVPAAGDVYDRHRGQGRQPQRPSLPRGLSLPLRFRNARRLRRPCARHDGRGRAIQLRLDQRTRPRHHDRCAGSDQAFRL